VMAVSYESTIILYIQLNDEPLPTAPFGQCKHTLLVTSTSPTDMQRKPLQEHD
jgi:hypothetical protein